MDVLQVVSCVLGGLALVAVVAVIVNYVKGAPERAAEAAIIALHKSIQGSRILTVSSGGKWLKLPNGSTVILTEYQGWECRATDHWRPASAKLNQNSSPEEVKEWLRSMSALMD